MTCDACCDALALALGEEGAFSPDSQALLHAEQCPDCSRLLAALAPGSDDSLLVRALAVPEPPADYWDALSASVRAQVSATRTSAPAGTHRRSALRPERALPLAAAATIAAAMFLWLARPAPETERPAMASGTYAPETADLETALLEGDGAMAFEVPDDLSEDASLLGDLVDQAGVDFMAVDLALEPDGLMDDLAGSLDEQSQADLVRRLREAMQS